MYDERPHPLLAQVPLTVSPFISLPTATTLPYTYKAIPSTLPPSLTPDRRAQPDVGKPAFVMSSGGQAYNPDELVQSSHNLEQHIHSKQDEAEKTISEWQKRIKDRELAEKRRVAPGWLDRDEKILRPEKPALSPSVASALPNLMDQDPAGASPSKMSAYLDSTSGSNTEGEQLDQAFGKSSAS